MRNKLKLNENLGKRYDVMMFKDMIMLDAPAEIMIGDHQCKYEISEGAGYLYIDNKIAKTLDKNVMCEAIDSVLKEEELKVETLSNFSVRELLELLEADENTESDTTLNPEDQKNKDDMEANPNDNYTAVTTDENGNEVMIQNQHIDTDTNGLNADEVALKDPATGKVSIVKLSNITGRTK